MSPRGIPFFFVALALAGCDIPNPGIPPVQATLNFPIAVGLSDPTQGTGGESDYLLVVNANYDARYNQGTVLSLDMRRIMARFDAVANDPLHRMNCTNPAAWDDPNVECQVAEAADVMADGRDAATHEGAEVWIDSFAGSIVRSPQSDRFYIPTRGTANLTWIDFDNATGAIDCGAVGSLRCDAAHRRTRIRATDECPGRTITLTGDPSGVVAMRLDQLTGSVDDADRDVVLMLQRNGTAALFMDDAALGDPVLTHVLTGLQQDAINAELEPSTLLGWVNTSSPVSTRASRALGRVGVFIDPDTEACSQAFAAPGVFLDGLATGYDTRDVAFSSDAQNRYAYVLSRSPESVITIDQQGTPFIPGNAAIVDVQPTGFGPSRIRRITIGGHDFLLVTCFDDGSVWIYGTQPTEVLSIVPGFNGPFELALDEERQIAVVADFKTSVLRFIDLSPLLHGHDAVVLGRVGTPRTHVGFP